MNEMLVTEEDIAVLVPLFYQRVRDDAVLGPIFNGAIGDWPPLVDLAGGRRRRQPGRSGRVPC